MLSDEEKKAIERLNIYKEKIKDELYPILDFEEEKAIGVVLNLIEKQSKEIEELKEKEKNLLIQLKDSEKELLEVCEKLRNSVSKDKIKEILGIEEDINNEKLLSVLQTIVDENARLEDNTEEIEELYIDMDKMLSRDNEEAKYSTYTCFKLMIDKINELVRAVNKLRKDKNNEFI